MLTNSKKIIYSTILTVIITAFLFTNERSALVEAEVAQGAYYRGEYLFTTYYPSPYGSYKHLQISGGAEDAVTLFGGPSSQFLIGNKFDTEKSSSIIANKSTIAYLNEIGPDTGIPQEYCIGMYNNFKLGSTNQFFGLVNFIRDWNSATTGKRITGILNDFIAEPKTASIIGEDTKIRISGGGRADGNKIQINEDVPISGKGSLISGVGVSIDFQSNLSTIYGIYSNVSGNAGGYDPVQDIVAFSATAKMTGTSDVNDKIYAICSYVGKNYFANDVYIGKQAKGAVTIGAFDKDPSTLGSDLYVDGSAGINGTMYIGDFMYLKPRSGAPASPKKGTIYYDSNDNKVYVNAGDETTPNWQALN